MMLTLRTLGGVALTGDDGRDHDGLLRQRKRLALLLVLASPTPGTWHRREPLMGLLWPEFAQANARMALRNALYVIRQELGPDVLRTRGDDEISVDPARLTSDAGILHAAFEAGDYAECLAAYRGEFLTGFYPSDAGGFEHWLYEERHRLQQLALKAASRLSIEQEQRGALAGAIELQRRMVEIAPDDEPAAQRLLQLLDRTGDRAGALAAYERLAAALQHKFESLPSPATMRLLQEIRKRAVPEGQPPTEPAPSPRAAEPPVAAQAVLAVAPAPVSVGARSPDRNPRPWHAGAMMVVTSVLILASLVSWRRGSHESAARILLLMPMQNATGDPGLDYVATGIAGDVAQRLSALKSVTVRSAAWSRWPATLGDSAARIGPAFGASILLRTTLRRVGDSLEVEGRAVDVDGGFSRVVGAERFAIADLREAGSRLAAAVAGALFRVPIPQEPRQAATRTDPEAYRLTLLGWHRLLVRDNPAEAREFFLAATRADPTTARAWSGLSSTWAAATANGLVSFEEGYPLAEAAALRALALDSLQGTAWANLGVMHALKERSVSAGAPFLQRAIAAEPANPEIYMVQATVLRFAGEWDQANDFDRIARQLDPLTAYYVGREATGAMCADRAEKALALYRRELELDPKERDGRLGVARSLARLGQWDDAITALRELGRSRHDTALTTALPDAHGEAGYWALKHLEGRALLAKRLQLAAQQWVAPYLLGVAYIGAGELDRGMTLLEQEARTGSRMVYKLSCNPEIDEVRSTPRFKQLMQVAGLLPLGSAP